jgi:hypothetical protein
MTTTPTYEGACFCGSVRIAVTGEPAAMGYCHCESCRQWSASPVNAFSLWPHAAVRVTQGEELIDTFNKTPRSYRKWCRKCGGHLFNVHPHWGLTDVYAAVLPSLPFQAKVHVNYQETVLRLHDGVAKFRDVPADMGGSGTAVAE